MYLFSQLPVVDAVVSDKRRKELNLNLYPSRFLFLSCAPVKKFKCFCHYEVFKKKTQTGFSPLFVFRVMEDSGKKNCVTAAVTFSFARLKV